MKLSLRIFILFGLIAGLFVLQSCDQNDRFVKQFFPKAAPPPYDSTNIVSDSTLPRGTKIYVVKKGTGPFHVVYKDKISVYITGRTKGGKVFKTSYTKRDNQPSTTILYNLTPTPKKGPLTTHYLIEGLRKGLIGMREGEKRIIRVPPSEGFTSPGTFKHGIKVSGKTLIYNVKLVQILP